MKQAVRSKELVEEGSLNSFKLNKIKLYWKKQSNTFLAFSLVLMFNVIGVLTFGFFMQTKTFGMLRAKKIYYVPWIDN
jgi:hypothetical protein